VQGGAGGAGGAVGTSSEQGGGEQGPRGPLFRQSGKDKGKKVFPAEE
jgi:hypothetical protein